MPPTDPFSLAQLTGYAAFALGVTSFLQKDDRRLRALVAAQACSYAVHFMLLGSVAAAVAALVTFGRALTSLYTRSPRVGVLIIALNIGLGFLTVKSAFGWLPVVAASGGTIAFFWFNGIAMRLILLGGTALWLTNNLLVGSIGGTLLELFIGFANGSTCYRLWRAGRAVGSPASP